MLLTVWAMLIVGGAAAYWTTRTVLLENMDAALVSRAAALPEMVHAPGVAPGLPPLRGGDRYLIKNDLGQTLARPVGAESGAAPTLVSASFTELGDGSRWRSVTLRLLNRSADGRAAPTPFTVTYSTPAEPFDRLLRRLAMALAAVGVAGGLLAAGLAVRVARIALRPLRDTAIQIGQIDERALDRRIDPAPLPPELLPVAHRLNEMLARLEQAFQQRQRFLSDASHELRTPVAALMTAVEIALRYPRDADAYRRTLESCSVDAAYLRQLVERLMDQVRSEAPGAEDAPEPVDPTRLLEQCAQVVRPLAEAKRIELRTDISPAPAGKPWLTQPDRVRSIFINLLSNAVEYTPAGGTVQLISRADGDGLLVEVTDTGCGITAEHLPHLFEPFYRADKSRARDAGHLGLGLALVDGHLRALGGTCAVRSEIGRGTTFTVRLPYQACAV